MNIFAIAIATSLLMFEGGTDKTREIEKRFPTQPNQRIEINGLTGSEITFRSWQKNEVYIKLEISISSSDESYEENYISGVSVTEEQSSEALVVTFREPDRSWRKSFWSGFKSFFSGWRVRKEISGEIYVPQSNALTTDMKYGSIALENMKRTLEAAGSSLEKVVKVTVFMRDMADFNKLNEVYAKYFPVDPPARTCVAVKEVPGNFPLKVECTALK